MILRSRNVWASGLLGFFFLLLSACAYTQTGPKAEEMSMPATHLLGG